MKVLNIVLGHYSLVLALLSSAWSIVAALLGAASKGRALQRSAERALWASSSFIALATGCLECHDSADEELARKHLRLPISTLECQSCHDPHASRMAGMLLPETHAPFASGDCKERIN